MIKLFKDIAWVARKKYTPKKWFIEQQYANRFGKKPNLSNPTTFSEKIQWLKLYYRQPGLHTYVDKYKVRDHITKTIGKQYLNEMVGVWDNPDDIDFESLPAKFALKATHATGTNIICSDKSKIDWQHEKEKLARYLRYDLYSITKEWAYKNIRPRIICESFLSENGQPPTDYKYFCFNGEPKLIQVDLDRFSNHTRSMLNTNWETLPFDYFYQSPAHPPKPPSRLSEQLELASRLAKPFPFVRIDFYCIKNTTYFGEMTFYPGSGYEKFNPPEWDVLVGKWLELPK